MISAASLSITVCSTIASVSLRSTERRHLMHVVECAAAETRDQAPSRTTAMFAWDPYAAFFLGGGDDVLRQCVSSIK